jgi:hypothetical protein
VLALKPICAWSGLGFGRHARGHRGQQHIEQALFGVHLGLVGDVFELLLAHHVDGDLDQVADHGFDIAADVADFGELRGFDLHEGRVGQLGQAAGDLGFADAGGADHDDVLGNDLFGQLGEASGGACGCAGRWRRRASRLVLADNILVELGTISRGVSSSSATCSSSAVPGR